MLILCILLLPGIFSVPALAAEEDNPGITSAGQHVHKMVRFDRVAATCTAAGKKAYYYCIACPYISCDTNGKKEITDEDSLIIPARGHTESKWKYNADIHWKECTVDGCGAILDGTSQGHEIGVNGKCTVCGFRQEMTANEGDSVIRIVIATVIAALVTGGIVLHAVLLKKTKRQRK